MDSRRDWPARAIAALALILGIRYLVWRVKVTPKTGIDGGGLSWLRLNIPLAVLVTAFYILYSILMRAHDPFHLALVTATAGLLVLSVVLAASGVSVAVCLIVLALAPAVTVIGYEILGHRHMAEVVERL